MSNSHLALITDIRIKLDQITHIEDLLAIKKVVEEKLDKRIKSNIDTISLSQVEQRRNGDGC